MANQRELRDLHEMLTNQIIEDRTREMDQFRAQQLEAAAAAETRARGEMENLKALGIDTAKLQDLSRKRTTELEKQYRDTESRMGATGPDETSARRELELQSALLPAGATSLSPVWTAAFSSNDDRNKLVDASSIDAQDLLTGGGCQAYWNQASGGGWGCVGSGVGEIQSWVYFGFWFLPNANRFWSVVPLFRFRGFYIVQADDHWYDCKSARVVASVWTNVYQYNWKGWNSVNVLDVSGDNINVNQRFDTDRAPYSSYLLGGGDWAWISCVIGLYSRGQGGGSFAKNDFATGSANYLCVPSCWVY